MNDDTHNDTPPKSFLSLGPEDDASVSDFLEDLETDQETASHQSDVMTSVTELRPEMGFATTKMSDEQLAVIAHSDASMHELMHPDRYADGPADAHEQGLWATTKMVGDNDHLLALADPSRVPDPEGARQDALAPADVEDISQLSTMKMSDYDIKRTLEGSVPLEEHMLMPARSERTTPVDKPSAHTPAPPARPSARASTPAPATRRARANPWRLLIVIAIVVLVALLAYAGLR